MLLFIEILGLFMFLIPVIYVFASIFHDLYKSALYKELLLIISFFGGAIIYLIAYQVMSGGNHW